ncbi:lysozyme [Nostoc phage Nsp-JY18]
MVETYQQQVRSRGANQQDLNVSVDPNAFGASIGRAVQAVGVGIGKLADARVARDNLMADNDARVAQNGFIEEARRLRYDPNTGYMNQTGGNALGRRASFESELDKVRAKYASGLSPQARRLFEQNTDSFVQSVREQAIRHDSEQLRTYTNSTAEATANTYLNEALLTYNNPQLFGENVNKAVAELERIGVLNGQSPEARAVAREKLISGAYAGAALRMADEGVGGATRAKQFIDENADLFTAEDRANLDKAIRPLVVQDSARIWVNEGAGVTPRPSEVYSGGVADGMSYTERAVATSALLNDPYARETRRRESGNEAGRLDAAPRDKNGNPISSARGPYQFVEGTWLSMVERARAKGGARWSYGLTREEILEYRWTGGSMAGRDADVKAANDEMFVEFRDYNREVLGRAGFEATPENEYLLHIFGEGGGINVLRAGDSAFIETVIGMDAAKGNNLVGVTVGQYKRRLAAAYGAPGAPNGGAEYDWAKLYADAAKIMETDPERGAAIIQELDRRRTAYETSQTQGRQATFDELYTRGVQTGDWTLSAQDAITLGASMSETFRAAAQNHMSGTQYTDPVVFTSLEEMAATDPENFLRLELGDFLKANELTDADYRTLRSVQTELASVLNPTPAQASAALSTAMNGIDPVKLWTDTKADYELITGVNPDSEKLTAEQRGEIARFKMSLSRAILEATQAKGSELTPVERQAVVVNMLEPVEVEQVGLMGTSTVMVPRFDAANRVSPGGLQAERVVPFEEISNDLRTALALALPPELPQGERKAQVERMFNDLIAVAQGRTPEVTIEDIPEEIFENGEPGGIFGFTEGLLSWGDEPDTYLIKDAEGATVRLTEGELLSYWADVQRERYLRLMAEANITPEQLLRERPAYVFDR